MLRLDDHQQMIQDTARRFARDRLAPGSQQWADEGRVPAEVLAEMGALGFMGMTVAPEWGGSGLDYVSYAVALMEIAAGDGAVSTIMSVNNAPVCAILQARGTEAQKERYLRPLAEGREIGAFALSEPVDGSDAGAIKTAARPVDGGFELTGAKQFVTSGAIARVVIVFAVTAPDRGSNGITAFVVPTDSPGLMVAGIERKMGQEASDTARLTFDGVAVGTDQVIGAPGDGYRIALANLETGRIGIAAQSVGMAQAAFDHAVRYVNERRSFGKALINHQAVAVRVADMATQVAAARALVLQAAAAKDAGEPCLTFACMAKLFASEMAERVCSGALQCLGGYGYTREFPIEKIARDVRVCQIYEGTSDIQRIVIARAYER